MSDPLLSSLCSICHVKPHNYRCPRCSVLTCSLPCIKRHKQWAECNGVRDPSVYMKQKDLATPKGIDHDYNYLTSIERELDHAERNAKSRGVILENDVRPRAQRYEKGEMALEAAFERQRITVVRAPKGMSRNKLNATRVTAKTRTLRWTVEWVHPDGTKALGMCPETQPISEAYTAHLNWLDPDHPGKRRKPNQNATQRLVPNTRASQGPIEQPSIENIVTTNSPNDDDPTDTLMEAFEAATLPSEHKSSLSGDACLTHSQLRKRRRKGHIERTTSKPKTRVELDSDRQLREWREGINRMRNAEAEALGDAFKAANEKDRLEKDYGEEVEQSEMGISGGAILESIGWPEGDDIERCRQQRTSNGTTPGVDSGPVEVEPSTLPESTSERPVLSLTEPIPKVNKAFYLHHPSLPSRHPVLIPIPPTATLASALSNRLVLEFPTVYVLHQHPDEKLPEGLVSEDDFFHMAKKVLIEELEEGELRSGDYEGSEKTQEGIHRDGEVDERRLIEVLGKDLKGIPSGL